MTTHERRGAILCSCCGQIELDAVQETLRTCGIASWQHDQLCSDDGMDFLADRISSASLCRLLICACADEDKVSAWQKTARVEGLQPAVTSVLGMRDRDPASLPREVRVAAAYQQCALPVAVQDAISVSRDVLVLGGSISGLRTALQLAEGGYRVTIADEEKLGDRATGHPLAGLDEDGPEMLLERVRECEDIYVRAPTRVLRADGQVGSFYVTFSGQNGETEEFGALVLATGCAAAGREKFLGVATGAEIVPVGHFAAAISREEALSVPGAGRPHQLAFIVPPDAARTEVPFLAAARAAREAGRLLNAEIYLLCNDAKVAAPGGERMYRDLRDRGVTVIRFDADSMTLEEAEVPRSYTDPAAMDHPLTLRFTGEVLEGAGGDTAWELALDRLFVADRLQLSEMGVRLADLLQVRRADDGFLGDDNVYQLPAGTNRPGILAVGSARRPATPAAASTDAANAASSVQKLLGEGVMSVDHIAAVVQSEECVLCLTCIRSCPHVAISISAEDDAAKVHREACRGCGICAGECPADAIQLEGYADDSFAAALDAMRGVQSS